MKRKFCDHLVPLLASTEKLLTYAGFDDELWCHWYLANALPRGDDRGLGLMSGIVIIHMTFSIIAQVIATPHCEGCA